MPPAAITTDSLATSNGSPPGSIAPRRPATLPAARDERVHAVTEPQLEQLAARVLLQRPTRQSDSARPVPQTRWNRGTELPGA